MRRLRKLVFSISGFLQNLVKPVEPIIGYSPNGHAILLEWKESPEESVINAFMEHLSRRGKRPLGALYAYEGPHQGQLLPLLERQNGIGENCGNSLTLSTDQDKVPGSYHLDLTKVPALSGLQRQFLLNGQPTHQALIYDYDEVELSGNKMLYWDFQGEDNA